MGHLLPRERDDVREHITAKGRSEQYYQSDELSYEKMRSNMIQKEFDCTGLVRQYWIRVVWGREERSRNKGKQWKMW
jgi:hypothetical protein